VNIEQANEIAVGRMMAAHPVLTGVARAGAVIPGLEQRMLLHAGPPITWDRMSGPLQGALIGASIFEGWAESEASATEMLAGGEIAFDPCHEHQAVGPMAGVISPSMAVYVVEDDNHSHTTFSNLNEGYGKVLRYGAYSSEVLDRLRWINDDLAGTLHDALTASEGMDIRALLAEALHMGDEGHNRNKAGSLLMLKTLAPSIAEVAKDKGTAQKVLQFMGDNALTVLNPVMAACKAMADAADGVEGSTIVSVMARNGTDFGIKLSGLQDRWFTAPAPTPDGLYFSGFSADDANPDIGDSTITETAGIGAFAMAAAPAIVAFVSGTPKDALNASLEMYEITVAESDYFTIPALGFRGTPTGIDIREVVELGITPRVNTGIAHRKAGIGQIGAGLVRPPIEVFIEALMAFAQQYDI
jgi:hypothetical protein